MAATRRPADALDFVKELCKGMPLERIDVRLLDDANKMMWMASPWRWTLGVLTPITVVAGQTDYNVLSAPALVYPVKAYLTNGQTIRPLEIEPVLPATPGIKGQTNKIAYIPPIAPATTGVVRLNPPMTSINAGETWTINVWYKKPSPTITRSNFNTAGVLEFDDEYFWVYMDGVLYRAYYYADDPRAGAATMQSNGALSYSGQLGIFHAGLQQMREMEPMLQQFSRPPDQERQKG